MNTRFVLALTVVVLALAAPSSPSNITTAFGVRGTLVVALATKQGLLVCADRRTYDPVRGDLDDTEKITQIGNRAAFASTGIPTFYKLLTNSLTQQTTLVPGFLADSVAQSFFQKNGFTDSETSWQGLARELVQSFESFLRSTPYKFWPETGNPPDNALFQLGVFFLDEDGRAHASYVRFTYIKSPVPVINVFKSVEPDASFIRVRPIALGNIAVFTELREGVDKRFDDVRREHLLKRFMREGPEVKQVSLTDAERFARRVIRLTSERTHLLESSTFHVGPTTDVALLDPKKGFRWVVKNQH